MQYFPPALETLTEQFARLPGIGHKSAQRLAFFILSQSAEDVQAFADALLGAKHSISLCPVCQNLTEGEGPCALCSSDKQDQGVICVVASPKDVVAIERAREYDGLYHVLHGVISPMNHVGPDDLHIRELVERVAAGGVGEVIMATNPDTEGEATAMYLLPAPQALPGEGDPSGLRHPGGQPPGVYRRRHSHARPGGTAGV